MVPVAITFLLVVGIVGGLYWILIERVEARQDLALRKRLKKVSAPSKLATLLKDPERPGDARTLNHVLAKASALIAPIERTVAQSGVKITMLQLFLASAVAALLGFAVGSVFLHMPLVGAVLALVAMPIPYWYVKFMRNRRMLKFEEQFPEAIDLLARALRAGHALTTGLSMVAEELPDPVGPEFKLLFDQQNFGLPLPQALKHFARRIPSIDARFFVTAVLTQREAGGNLSEVLDNLSSIIRDRFRVKRQVRVISAHGRITGWILSALPTSLGLFFAATSPEKYSQFYTDPFGIKMIVGALLLQLLGVFIIKRIVTIEY